MVDLEIVQGCEAVTECDLADFVGVGIWVCVVIAHGNYTLFHEIVAEPPMAVNPAGSVWEEYAKVWTAKGKRKKKTRRGMNTISVHRI